MCWRGTQSAYSRSIIMSGDAGPVKQPLRFYSKEPTDIKDILLQTGKVKTVYVMDGEPEKVYVHFHDTDSISVTRAYHYNIDTID